jgi:hypothetical protein
MAKAKVELHLARVPPADDPEARVQMVIDMGNQMFGTRPTDEEIADVRKILGAPAKPQAKRRLKPKAKAVKKR